MTTEVGMSFFVGFALLIVCMCGFCWVIPAQDRRRAAAAKLRVHLYNLLLWAEGEGGSVPPDADFALLVVEFRLMDPVEAVALLERARTRAVEPSEVTALFDRLAGVPVGTKADEWSHARQP